MSPPDTCAENFRRWTGWSIPGSENPIGASRNTSNKTRNTHFLSFWDATADVGFYFKVKAGPMSLCFGDRKLRHVSFSMLSLYDRGGAGEPMD